MCEMIITNWYIVVFEIEGFCLLQIWRKKNCKHRNNLKGMKIKNEMKLRLKKSYKTLLWQIDSTWIGGCLLVCNRNFKEVCWSNICLFFCCWIISWLSGVSKYICVAALQWRSRLSCGELNGEDEAETDDVGGKVSVVRWGTSLNRWLGPGRLSHRPR